MTSADRIKSGEVYRVVVDNLRQNLEVIKNYEEVRLIFFSISPLLKIKVSFLLTLTE